MKRVYVEDLSRHTGEQVEIAGWLYNQRGTAKLRFLLVRDGSGIVQCIAAKNELGEGLFALARSLTQETSLAIRGTVRADERAPGGYELLVTDLAKINDAHDYPITPKEHGTPFLLDRRHLWLRSKKQHAMLRIRHELIWAIRDFFNNRGFICFDTPMFTPNAVEGTTDLFAVNYFDTSAYLTQSGQLYAEAGAMAHGRVYTFGPTFRAEKSKTRRHLTEFWMVEPEVAFIDLDGLIELAEEMTVYIVERVLERRCNELADLERDTAPLEAIRRPFPRLHYDEAAEILVEYAKQHPDEGGVEFKHGDDFGGRHETILSDPYHRPVFITHFPAQIKPFYMKRDPDRPDCVLGFDMLGSEGAGELIGGSVREDDHDTLVQRIREHDLPMDAFDWYLDLRKYGSVPHGGFGLGLERTITWLSGRPHLREAIPFPRMLYRMRP
ncbi:MAG: Asparagine--tRNA ligase [Calditrichaeota bacterium]|nr:Asparagine--tRNA ligase [Calditrichota bacterium]